MSQVQQAPNIYKPGIKQHVSFTSLKELEKYEPNVSNYSEIKDGERVEMAEYSYRLGSRNLIQYRMNTATIYNVRP